MGGGDTKKSLTTREQIAIMEHYANGGNIELRPAVSTDETAWVPVSVPAWNWQKNEYRVANEEPQPCVVHSYADKHGSVWHAVAYSEKDKYFATQAAGFRRIWL